MSDVGCQKTEGYQLMVISENNGSGFKVDDFVKSPNRPLFVIPDERSEIRNPVISSTYGCRIKKACPGPDPGSGMTFRALFTIVSKFKVEKTVAGCWLQVSA
jgi:hypothetical protein